MSLFRKHFLAAVAEDTPAGAAATASREAVSVDAASVGFTAAQERRYRELSHIVCDEEALLGPHAQSPPS